MPSSGGHGNSSVPEAAPETVSGRSDSAIVMLRPLS